MDRLLTVRELADHLRVTQTSVYRWLAADRLPAIRFSKRCVRFRESEVQKMLDQLAQATARDVSKRQR
jgi:excisionase family DNA binding protein